MEPKYLIGNRTVNMKLPGIYMIYCIVSGKAYIGQSKDIQKRLREHKRLLRLNKHDNNHLQSSFNKNSEASFSFIGLENCDKTELTTRENYYMELINDWKFNILRAGNVWERTEEFRKASSVRQKGVKKSDEFKKILVEAHKNCKCHTPEGVAIRTATLKKTIASKPKTVNLYNAKLTIEQVKEIKVLMSQGKSAIEIGKQFNTPRQTIHSIRRGDSWKNV